MNIINVPLMVQKARIPSACNIWPSNKYNNRNFGTKYGRVGNTGIETNSLQHHYDTLQPVFRMSVYNIVRKHKVLETNLKSEEIMNFYPIFLYI